MDAMLGYDMGVDVGHEIDVLQEGSQVWSGKVVIWNNFNGIHGRRVSGAAPGQWATGDTITLQSCLDPEAPVEVPVEAPEEARAEAP